MFAYARAAIDWWPGWLTETEFKKHLVEISLAPASAIGWLAFRNCQDSSIQHTFSRAQLDAPYLLST
jgi:hypothetical protein